MDIHSQKVLILDFGSQYTQVIARRVREAKVYCEIHPYNLAPERLRALDPAAVVLSGGPSSVISTTSSPADRFSKVIEKTASLST